MNSSFLPIFSSPSHVVAGTSELGGAGEKTIQGDQPEGSVPFAEVLGERQQAQEQNANTLEAPSKEETNLEGSVFSEGNSIDELRVPDLNQDALPESVVAQLVSQDQVVGINPVGTATHLIGTPNPLPHGAEHVVGLENLPGSQHERLPVDQNILYPSVQRHGHASLSVEQNATQGRMVQADPKVQSFSILDQASRQGETIRQAVVSLTHNAGEIADSGLRVRPLLQEHTQANLGVRPPLNLVNSVVDGLEVNIQRQVSAQDAAVTTLKSDTGSLGVNPLLSQQREDLSQLFSRTDGEGRSSGTLGISSGSDAGLGTAGSGLSFGHHAGNGQGPLLDSSTGTLVSANHGQVAAKGGGFEDRLQLLNVPVPQRLQIDVQLSEAARVQVDVGVQQRQVYAGVLLDNPVLRTLATQNVQELESQLRQSDMELEEFDVHEDNPFLSDQHGQEHFQERKSSAGFSGESIPSVSSQGHEESFRPNGQDTGWHFVA